jgi:hypothetical protein
MRRGAIMPTEKPDVRVIHWYDTGAHRNACGAPGQSSSTKHVRGVTCQACLALSAKASDDASNGALGPSR